MTIPNQNIALLSHEMLRKTNKRILVPLEALLVMQLEAMQVGILLDPCLKAGEAQTHIKAGIQVL